MSVSDRLAAWKNRLIASPDFQAFALSNPITRLIANHKAAQSFDLVAGFVYSQILAAAAETDLITLAANGAISKEDFALISGLPLPGAERLMLSAAALGLLRKRADGQFDIGEMGAALLGNPSVFAMIYHHRVLYRDLEDITQHLRARTSETGLGRFWAYDPDTAPEEAGAYSKLMAETQALIAAEVIRLARFDADSCLMDVGGGTGVFLERVGQHHPQLSLRLADLPPVARHARERLASGPLGGRTEIFALDFLSEPLPQGADIVSLIRVLHDHDDDQAFRLLTNIRKALPPDGRLLLAEPMADAPGAARMGEAYFGMYLWVMGRGRPRRFAEIKALLQRAGFRSVTRKASRTPLLVSIFEAR